jgi:hypothetical protein
MNDVKFVATSTINCQISIQKLERCPVLKDAYKIFLHFYETIWASDKAMI